MTPIRIQFLTIGVVAALGLNGCAVSSSAPSQSNENREASGPDQFDEFKLPEQVRSSIQKAFVEKKKFNKMVAEYSATETKNGVDRTFTSTVTEYGREHGLVVYQNEVSGNGIPFRDNNGISILGMLTLDSQSVLPQRTGAQRSPPEIAVKKIDFIYPSPVTVMADSSFLVNYRVGREDQPKAVDFAAKFKFGLAYPASKINPALQGDALECEMEQTNERGALMYKHKFIYLLNYGATLWVQSDSSTTEATYSIKSVQVE